MTVLSATPTLLTHATPADRLGRPLHDLRLSVIDACNFRCPYCMPEAHTTEAHGVDSAARMDFDDMHALVTSFVELGVSKLRITGGEPLLRKRLPELISRLSAIDGLDDIALTTNGSLLAAHAQALRAAGLQRLTVSLDALDADVFQRLSGGRGRVRDVLAGISAAEAAGFGSIKLNCVVQRGVNDGEVMPLVAHFRGSGHVLRFIEYMDVGSCNGWSADCVVPSAELRDRIHARWPVHAVAANYRGEVASRVAFDDGKGEIGFVSSITAPFCGDCHRARVSADGRLYTCLFSGTGTDLRDALKRGGGALTERIASVWQGRGDRYSELRGRRMGAVQAPGKRVEMFLVGG